MIGFRHATTILNAIKCNIEPVNLVTYKAREHLHQSFRPDTISNEMTLIIWLNEINTSLWDLFQTISKHLRANPSDLKQAKLYNGRTYKISNRFS